ncbi:unnamed protein product, partial [Prunus brigantina]
LVQIESEEEAEYSEEGEVAYPRPAQHNRRMTEQPKKEMSIKMPGDDKPLATIIEGRWYAVGKSGRPTMELTRTQKRRIQRRYCTFLSNENIAQILLETNSAKKGKEPEKPPQAEQAIFHSQKMLKTKSPDKPCVHLTSSSGKQLEASQVEEEPEPVPAEKQEDWIEENEEEQLDYEPSTDDQNALLGMEGQEDWTEEYGEEQHGLHSEAFGAELEGLLQSDLGINMVFILSEKFWAAEGQEKSTLERDVFSQESFEYRLAEAEETSEQQADSPKAGRTALLLQTNQGDGKSPQALQLALWNEEGYMEIVEADPRPFLPSAMCFEARYYHDDLGPFTFLGVKQNGCLHGVTAQRLIEDGLASSLEDWNRPFVLKLQNSDV